MEAREVLQELHLALEGAVDQVTRAQRLVTAAAGAPLGLSDLGAQVDGLFAELVALRNQVREALMKELSKAPKKLPIV
ncbi:MAG TPA: hypothetical protein VKN99_00015 [Polyangia bacterium]|nr:hypothetical protein [Polyangia bacterium]